MKRVTLIVTAVVLAVIATLAGRATAQETNTQERTFLTFSNAVEMPGVTLQAGTYVFKLADSPSRNVVQVWDRDEKNMIGHWTFVQAERTDPANETIVMFKETAEGSTPAVQFWYFPGERVGKEFIYPKDQAERIAARTGADVRSETSVEAGAVASAQSASADVRQAPEPEPAPAPVAAAPAVVAEAPAPAPEPAAPAIDERRVTADVSAQAESAPRAVGTGGQDELPRTASPLALAGLLGLLSLAGAAGLRAFRS